MIEMCFVDCPDGCVDIGICRQQDTSADGIEFARLCQKSDTEHRGHSLITDQHCERVASRLELSDGIQGRCSRVCGENAIVLTITRSQITPYRRQYLRIVINN